MKEAKKTLLRVIGIMWGLAAVVLIVGAILFAIHPFPYFPYVSGEVLGTLVSGLLMWHRFNTLDVELDMAKKNAIRHLRMQASVRSLISLLTLLLSFYFVPPQPNAMVLHSLKQVFYRLPMLNYDYLYTYLRNHSYNCSYCHSYNYSSL